MADSPESLCADQRCLQAEESVPLLGLLPAVLPEFVFLPSLLVALPFLPVPPNEDEDRRTDDEEDAEDGKADDENNFAALHPDLETKKQNYVSLFPGGGVGTGGGHLRLNVNYRRGTRRGINSSELRNQTRCVMARGKSRSFWYQQRKF